MVNGYKMEQIRDFKYLGINISEKNNIHNESILKLSQP